MFQPLQVEDLKVKGEEVDGEGEGESSFISNVPPRERILVLKDLLFGFFHSHHHSLFYPCFFGRFCKSWDKQQKLHLLIPFQQLFRNCNFQLQPLIIFRLVLLSSKVCFSAKKYSISFCISLTWKNQGRVFPS